MKKTLLTLGAVFAACLSAVCADYSYWLWPVKPIAPGVSRAYFRADVNIASDVVSAEIYMIVDDSGNLYVNGRDLKNIAWTQPKKPILIRKYDIKSLLKKGPNTLAVIVANSGGPGGIILKGEIKMADGKSIAIVSNKAQWKGTMTAQRGRNWMKPGFDDSSWNAPWEQGDASMKPWAGMSNAVEFFGVPKK